MATEFDNTIVRELVEQLYKVDGKAEIVDGRIERMGPTGSRPSRAAGKIYVRLLELEKYFELTDPEYVAHAYTDNIGYVVSLPNRNSFSPDTSFYVGPDPGMKFINEAPLFAVEVRSENDYGNSAEMKLAAKRRDYFECGTKAVWDVDLENEEVIKLYSTHEHTPVQIFKKNQLAHANPAIPNWEFKVSELFE